jgi:hypothetical protein
MIATPTMVPTFTANRTTTIAPSTPPTMATVTTLTPTTTLGDDDDGRPTRASLWCDMPHRGGGAYTGLDSLLMPPPPARLSDAAAAATATSSYSRSVVPHRRQNDDNAAAAVNVTNETKTTPTPDCCRRLGEHPPPNDFPFTTADLRRARSREHMAYPSKI